jgi:YbbR domain-containing protein
VTRLFWLVVHNWPLKLAALGLATLLYGGLVLSESASTLEVNIPIDPQGSQPDNTFIVRDIPPVTEVRYVSPSGARAISSTFTATVDLSGVVPGSGPTSVPVVVQSVDDRINVIDFTPDVVTVQLDELKTKTVPVTVDPGTIPDGLAIGTPTVSPAEVEVSGPASVVANVVAARASPVIQTSGLNIDQSLPLTPIDRLGDAVSPVNVEPDSARVNILVFEDLRSRSVVVNPIVTGTPAAGFEIATITVDPPSVTVQGDAERLAALESIDTEQVSVSGASTTVEMTVELDPPDGVTPLLATTVDVTVTFRPIMSTRTFEVGYRYVGDDIDLRYSVPVDRVVITVGGSKADLDRLEGSTLVADLDVGDLEPGTTDVDVTVDLPPGITLVSADPASVPVTVTAPPPPSPSPSAAPAVASPSASPAG